MRGQAAAWAAAWAVALAAGIAAAEDWPRFRGPNGQGVSAEPELPLKWSERDGVAWRTELPGQGLSSPIVWGDTVYLTATTEGGRSCRVIAVGRADGAIRWDVEAFRQEVSNKHDRNSFATPTPTTDGRLVYAVFHSGGIAAVEAATGKLAWRSLAHRHYSQHGLGASPVLVGDVVVMPFDGSSEGPDLRVGWQTPWEEASLIALRRRDGAAAWTAKRGKSRIAHVTPIVTDGQLVSPAGDVIQGFDPKDGRLLWTVPSEGEGVTPSPALGDGVLLTGSGFGRPTLRAVRLAGGVGAKAWENTRNVPSMPSPVFVKGRFFTVSERGVAQALDARTGETAWQGRVPGSYSASPLAGAGRIYLTSDDGETLVLADTPPYAILARNPLPGRVAASLAASGGRLFLRTDKALYALGR